VSPLVALVVVGTLAFVAALYLILARR